MQDLFRLAICKIVYWTAYAGIVVGACLALPGIGLFMVATKIAERAIMRCEVAHVPAA